MNLDLYDLNFMVFYLCRPQACSRIGEVSNDKLVSVLRFQVVRLLKLLLESGFVSYYNLDFIIHGAWLRGLIIGEEKFL